MGMAYDALRQQVVLFGGFNWDTCGIGDGTWTWDGTTWTKHSPASEPSQRDSPAMTFDAAKG